MAKAATQCPACRTPIPTDDINIAEGVGYCRACDKLWKLRELASDPEDAAAEAAALAAPPSGCWLRDLGSETVIGCTCRGWMGCFFLFFSAFWNSIVSIFLMIAFAGLYSNLVGPLPTWFPGANANVQVNGTTTTAATMPLGMVIFLLIFLIPFVLIGIGTAIAALMGFVGKLELTIRGNDVTLFTGIGPLGWKRRFSADAIRDIRITETPAKHDSTPTKQIEIRTDTTIAFGTLLTEPRRRWLAGVLRRLLVHT